MRYQRILNKLTQSGHDILSGSVNSHASGLVIRTSEFAFLSWTRIVCEDSGKSDYRFELGCLEGEIMTSDKTDEGPRLKDVEELRLLSPRELVKQEFRHLEVKEGETLLLSPSNREFASTMARVPIRSFEDLQLLGLAPKRLTEDKVRHAIAADDAEVYQLATRDLKVSSQGCGCSGETHRSPGSAIRSAYNGLRNRHNPALSRLLSDLYQTDVAWDSPVSSVTRKWVGSLRLSPIIIAHLFGDIVIHRNATLSVAASSKSLLAWNIYIHKTGKLVSQGGYLKIWANSMRLYTDFLSANLVEAARKVPPLWTLHE